MYSNPLISFEKKLTMIRTLVDSVALKYSPGFFLYGSGGIGKTFTVTDQLQENGLPWQMLNGDLTAAGLFDFMSIYRDQVLVLDDMEFLLSNKVAVSYLRAATWGNRTVTKTIKNKRFKFQFSGGIIILSNEPIGRSNILLALAQRLQPYEFEPSDEELLAMMNKIAYTCPHGLSTDSCQAVLKFLIANLNIISDTRLNLRIYMNALNARLMFEKGDSQVHWKDLIACQLSGKIIESSVNYQRKEPSDVKSRPIIMKQIG
jgi:hypothetical protein